MNVNPIIKAALDPLGYPVEANRYEGPAEEYITFNYADERPSVYADDIDVLDETTVYVHFFTRGNPQATKKSIRQKLRKAGFMIISTDEFYEADTKYNHVVVTVWIEGIIDE